MKIFKKKDMYLLLAVLLFGGGVLIYMYFTQKTGSMVAIYVNGVVYETVDLQSTATITIETDDGGENVIEIADGKVRMISANCPDQICVNHRAIDAVNESIICLPHGVSVEIRGDSSDEDIDAFQ